LSKNFTLIKKERISFQFKSIFMNKQRLFGFLALITMSATVASAQTYYQVGVTTGVNYSSLRSDLFTTSSGRSGLVAGFSVALGINDRFELNPEIVFTQKGASAKAVSFRPEEAIEVFSRDYYYNTFEAGMIAGYQPVLDVPVRLQAGGFFGTYFNYNDSRDENLWVGNYENLNYAMPADKLNPAFAGLDFGPVVGLSAGSGQLRLNIRYYLGVKNLYDNLDYVAEGHRISTSAFRVSLTGYLK